MENEQEKIEESSGDKELKVKKSDLKSATNKAIKKKVQPWWMWPVKILVVTLFLSLAFSVLSEVLLSNVGIVVSVVVILFLLFVGIVADMIGVATTACSLEPFTAMCSRKVRGAKVAMGLVKNAEKVSSICNDVVGDICGILSGAAGASIAVKFISENMANSIQILIAGTVSAVIAGLTIFGKAMCKKYAITHCTKIVLGVGKCFSIFSRRKPKEKKKQEKVEKE